MQEDEAWFVNGWLAVLVLQIFCYVFSSSVHVINGIQAPKHENGLSGGEASCFEEIIQLTNHGGANGSGREKSESDIPNEPIPAFDGGNAFLKKTGPMKPQHVAGEHRGSSATLYIWAEEKEQKLNTEIFMCSLMKKTACLLVANLDV